ncbi:LuxR C-terminal-related transcriptional regulator [uncultured Aquincola sp.]|uniref:helix-turn-helix transcriptional regulator n=1 Tax=uncultured Aquincola sp. TaxID=886556 RepID=UPI0032B2ED72
MEQAINAAHAGASDPARWGDCVKAIAAATNSAGTGLFRPGPSGGPIANHGTFLGLEAIYFKEWAHRDPWNEALKKHHLFHTAGELYVSREFLSDEDYRATAYYNEYGRHRDSGHKLVLKVSDDRDPVMPVTHLTFSRSFRQEPFGESERHAARRLWLPLQRALKAQALLTMDGRIRALSAEHFDAHPSPSWVLRRDGRIDHANQAARELMSRDQWAVFRGAQLAAIGNMSLGLLEKLILDAVQGRGSQHLILHQGSKKKTVELATLHITPIAKAPLYSVAWPHAEALLVLERAPQMENASAHVTEYFATRYRLTPAEKNVFSLLGEGLSPKQISAQLKKAHGTILTQVKSILKKMGVKSIRELILLILGNR